MEEDTVPIDSHGPWHWKEADGVRSRMRDPELISNRAMRTLADRRYEKGDVTFGLQPFYPAGITP